MQVLYEIVFNLKKYQINLTRKSKNKICKGFFSQSPNEVSQFLEFIVFLRSNKCDVIYFRSFKPDFVLVRQNVKDAGEDYTSILLGLKYGNVPSVNSLDALYNFRDKPWVFAHLLDISRRLGSDILPVIQQSYYPNHLEMVSFTYTLGGRGATVEGCT